MRRAFDMQIRDTKQEIVDPAISALVVVDVQNDFTHPEGVLARGGTNLETLRELPWTTQEVVGLARDAGVLIVWIKNTTLPHGLGESPAWHAFKTREGNHSQYTLTGTWGHALAAPLEPRDDEPIVEKSRSSAFIRTPLEGVLRSNGIESVVAVGCMTEGCVESTVRNALHLDFYAGIVTDAVATTRQDWHRNSLHQMHSQCELLTRAELEDLWAR